jgi:D-alanyl-D-alanine carboxypeptidase/D-alanyl-D-alanine-endopeptidase (penicillin-binding protein 4)
MVLLRRAFKAPATLWAIAFGVLLAAPSVGAATLPPRLQQALDATDIPGTAVSVSVRDTSSGKILLDLNARAPRSPASTLKVLTTYAALDRLGPTYTWTTRAYATGPVSGGHLHGDLVLEGGGDPYLTAERWEHFARLVRDAGIRHVDGDVVIDRGLYAAQEADADDFDGHGLQTYNVLPDPLLVNLQSVEFHLVPRGAGRVGLSLDPQPANLVVDNSVRLLGGRCRTGLRGLHFGADSARPMRVSISGQLAARCAPIALRRVVMPAPEFAYGTFLTNFREAGGEVDGTLRLGTRPPDARVLVEYASLPLAEVIRLVNKYSINPMARMVFLSLALDAGGNPASTAAAETVAKDWLRERGIACPELVLDNGSGLSREARISADCMARILTDAWHNRYFTELAASLPLGGEDGTLRNRFLEHRGEGRVRLKTGHLNGVGAVAGWVTDQSGQLLSVVAIVNHPGAQYAGGQQVVDTVVRWALAQ